MKKLLTLLSAGFISFTCFAYHPVHLSVTNLQYFNDSNRIEYSVRLFYDDFQQYLNYKYNTLIDFSGSARMTMKEQDIIINYLKDNFILKYEDQNKRLKVDFEKWQVSDNTVWLFFCAHLNEKLEGVMVENTIMLDVFADQQNLLIVNSDNEQTGVEFSQRKTNHLIKFR